MTIRVKQESTPTKTTRWNWSVWLDGPKEELDQVDHVVYTLHPTFYDPVRTIKSRRTQFKLATSGWGEFEIHIDIVARDGKRSRRKHWLRLEDTRPAHPPSTGKVAAAKAAKAPIAFLSYGVADAPTADAIRDGLETAGFEVACPTEIFASGPIERAINDMLHQAAIAVFVVSRRPSLWQSQEIAKAVARKGLAVIPVLVGDDTPLPQPLTVYQAYRLRDSQEAANLVEQVVGQALKGDDG